jgi:hypothetical protein
MRAHQGDKEAGFSLLGALLGLGFLGFFISVSFTGLDAARRSTEDFKADLEFQDLRISLKASNLCQLSCSEAKKRLTEKIGRWQLASKCVGNKPLVYAKLAPQAKGAAGAGKTFHRWQPLGFGPGGSHCYASVGKLDSARGRSIAGCAVKSQRIVAVDFSSKNVVCQ